MERQIRTKDVVFLLEVCIFWLILAGILNLQLDNLKMPLFLASILLVTAVTILHYLIALFALCLNLSAKVNLYLFSFDSVAVINAFLNAGNNLLTAFVLNYVLYVVLISFSSTEASMTWLNILFTNATSSVSTTYIIFYIAVSSAVVIVLYSLLMVVYFNILSTLPPSSEALSSFTDFAVLVFVVREFYQRILWKAEIKLCGDRSGSVFEECSYTEKKYAITFDTALEIVVVFSGLIFQEALSLRICAAYLTYKKKIWYLIFFIARLCLLAEVAIVVFVITDETILDDKFRIVSYVTAAFVLLCVVVDLLRVAAFSETKIEPAVPTQSADSTKAVYSPLFSKVRISKQKHNSTAPLKLNYHALRTKND